MLTFQLTIDIALIALLLVSAYNMHMWKRETDRLHKAIDLLSSASNHAVVSAPMDRLRPPAPSVGRIVHLCGLGDDGTPRHYAAVITGVSDWGGYWPVSLYIFPTSINCVRLDSDLIIDNAEYSEDNKPYTWHYPERVV